MTARTKRRKHIPKFASEQQEAEFWATHDSTDYVNWESALPAVAPELKRSQRTISLRMPEMMVAELKRLANQRDVPYQSLLKMFVAERLEQERRSRAGERGSAHSLAIRRFK